jgi:hypothetical protein
MGRYEVSAVPPGTDDLLSGVQRYARSRVDPALVELIRARARLVGTGPPDDPDPVTSAPPSPQRARWLAAVADWPTAGCLDERERTALALTDALTGPGAAEVPEEVWAAAARVWSERDLADLVLVITTVDAAGRATAAGRLRRRARE